MCGAKGASSVRNVSQWSFRMRSCDPNWLASVISAAMAVLNFIASMRSPTCWIVWWSRRSAAASAGASAATLS